MTNEYGEQLDSNGYAPSIIPENRQGKCYICFKQGDLVRHEPFNGANRSKSQNLGLWVTLCPFCHRMCHQYPKTYGESMKREMQSIAMQKYGWSRDDWHRIWGKSYLLEFARNTAQTGA